MSCLRWSKLVISALVQARDRIQHKGTWCQMKRCENQRFTHICVCNGIGGFLTPALPKARATLRRTAQHSRAIPTPPQQKPGSRITTPRSSQFQMSSEFTRSAQRHGRVPQQPLDAIFFDKRGDCDTQQKNAKQLKQKDRVCFRSGEIMPLFGKPIKLCTAFLRHFLCLPIPCS